MQNQIIQAVKKLIGILLSISFFVFMDFALGSVKVSPNFSNDTTGMTVSNTGSMVGNLKKGDTTIIAGENYSQSGSAVNSVKGDVNVLAKVSCPHYGH